MAKTPPAADAVETATGDAPAVVQNAADAAPPAADAVETATVRFIAPKHTSGVSLAGVPYDVVDGVLELPADVVTPEAIGTIIAHGFVAE